MPVTLLQIGKDRFPSASGVVVHDAGANRAKTTRKDTTPAMMGQKAPLFLLFPLKSFLPDRNRR